MGKVSYTNLKLQINTDVKICDFKNQKIEVLQYASIKDKYDLVMIALQKSLEDGIYNPIKIDTYFHLGLVYVYSNLNITDKQREDEFKLYDTLASNGLIDEIINLIPEEEYTTLQNYMDELIKYSMKYKNTAVSLFRSIIDDLPKNAQAAKEIVDNFDKDNFKEVIEFARAANGNRPI